MERFQPAAKYLVLWLRHAGTASASSVWQPQFPVAAGDAALNATVVELPLFTLGPKWFEPYAYIGVGSPSQSIRVLFDTMSSDLTVLGYDRSHHEMYKPDQSSSFVANNTLVLTALPATHQKALGVLAQDRVALSPEMRMTKQTFTALLQTSKADAFFDDTRADGWFGLARSKTQQAFPTASLMDVLIKHNIIREPVIGIHLNPQFTGLITLGGINSDRFEGNLSYVNVAPLAIKTAQADEKKDRYWSFHINYILVDGQPVYTPLTASVAVLDALQPSIQGPRDAVDAINAALGQDDDQRVPCHDGNDDTPTTILVVLDGMALELGRQDLVIPAANGPGCVSMLVAANQPMTADWSIGAPLLMSFYMALDFGDADRSPRIGFARRKAYTPPKFSAYDSLWLVLLGIVLVLIMRSLGRAKLHSQPRYERLHQ